jgi:hypothetical protein
MNQSDFDKQFSEIQVALKARNIAYNFIEERDIWEYIGRLPLDKSFTRLARLYLAADDSQKNTLYSYYGGQRVLLENSWCFVRRLGRLIHSQDDLKWLEVALASAMLDGARGEFRDLIDSLVVVRFIAERCDIDIKSAFDPFIQSASEEMKGLLENVRDHPEASVHFTVQTCGPPEWVLESIKIFGVNDLQTLINAGKEKDEKQREAAQQKKNSFLKMLGDLFKGK